MSLYDERRLYGVRNYTYHEFDLMDAISKLKEELKFTKEELLLLDAIFGKELTGGKNNENNKSN